jgi:hypothetical protein
LTDDLMAQFATMQKHTAALRLLLSDAQERAPRESSGTDETGAVQVVLGPDGLPSTMRVDPSWQQAIGPAGVGSAVMDAFQAAVKERMDVWTEALAEDGFQDRVEEMKRGRAPESRVPAAFRKPVPKVVPRPIGAVAEDMFVAFDKVRTSPPSNDPAAGADRSEKVTITLSTNALTACTVDAEWAEEQSGTEVTEALGEALRAAKRQLAQSGANRVDPAGGLDGLFAETMALLNDPRRFAD